MKKRQAILYGTILIGIMLLMYLSLLGRREIKASEKVLQRNLELKMLFIPKEPENREIAWHSELPDFIEKDMKYLTKHSEIKRIRYKYEDFTVEIHFYPTDDETEGEFVISVKNPNSCEYGFEWDDFSVYKGNNGNIVIYGYQYGDFDRIEINKYSEQYQQQTMTTSSHIPIGIEGKVISVNKDYVVFAKEGKEIGIYQNGKLLVKEEDDVGIIQYNEVYYNGMFLNNEKELFMTYTEVAEGGKASIHIERIGKVDVGRFELKIRNEMLSWHEISFSENDELVKLPIFLVEGEYCVPVPNDWETYEFYVGILKEKPKKIDFGMELKPLKGLFQSAKISFDYSVGNKWTVEYSLDLNGKVGTDRYPINGYDSDVELSEEERKLEFYVEDEDSFWNAVEEVRQMYQKYYMYPIQ